MARWWYYHCHPAFHVAIVAYQSSGIRHLELIVAFASFKSHSRFSDQENLEEQ